MSVPSKTVICVTVQTVGKTFINAPIDNPSTTLFIANCVMGDTCSVLNLQALAPIVDRNVLYTLVITAALAVEFYSRLTS